MNEKTEGGLENEKYSYKSDFTTKCQKTTHLDYRWVEEDLFNF